MLENVSVPFVTCMGLGSFLAGLRRHWQVLCDFDKSGQQKLRLLASGLVVDDFGDLLIYNQNRGNVFKSNSGCVQGRLGQQSVPECIL